MLKRPLRVGADLLACRPAGGPRSGLSDQRLLALTRAACAAQAPLRRPFLRGRWHAAHLQRVAAAVAQLAARSGEIDADEMPDAGDHLATRLNALIAGAPTVGDGRNSLAEFLGGRASSHPDRLTLIPRLDRPPDDATPPDAA